MVGYTEASCPTTMRTAAEPHGRGTFLMQRLGLMRQNAVARCDRVPDYQSYRASDDGGGEGSGSGLVPRRFVTPVQTYQSKQAGCRSGQQPRAPEP